MAQQGGGKLWRALGPLGTESGIHSGVIGESLGVATLRLTFSLGRPSTVFVRQVSVAAFTDRYIALALQDGDGRRFGLNEQGRAVGVDIDNTDGDESIDRLPAGDYAVIISTSQWQEIPFSFGLQVFALEAPDLRLQGRARLRGRLSTIRPEVFLHARGGMRASLQPVASLAIRLVGWGRPRMGLQIIPSYEQPPPAGLGHAWRIRQFGAEGRLRIGAATGLSWATVNLSDDLGSYIPTELSLTDFRFNPGRRMIFSDRAFDIYGAYPELGISQTVFEAQASPDFPGIPYRRLTNGRHRREVAITLPLEKSRCVVFHLEETLAWNNDIIRDLDDALPLSPRLAVSNRRRSWLHRRRVNAFVTDGTLVRRLQNPPAALLARLDAILPPLDGYLLERGVRVPGPSFRLPALRILYPSFIASGVVPGPGDQVFGADPTDRSAGALISFGMSRLLAADAAMGSAAIYSTLEDFEAIIAKPDYDPKATGFVIANLPDRPDGLPVLSPWYRDGGYRLGGGATEAFRSTTPQLLRYGRWNGPLPGRTDTEVASADLRWLLAIQGLEMPAERLFRGENPTLLLAYDWNDGAYCAGKLQLLGFTEEDLRTAPPEQRQQGTLNAGLPRPLRGRGGLALGTLVAQQIRNLRCNMRSRGQLPGDLAWGPRGRLRARGQLSMTLVRTPDLNIVRKLLRCWMTAQGVLSDSELNDAPFRLTARGSLGRPWLSAKPPNEFPQSWTTGRGQLVATLSAT